MCVYIVFVIKKYCMLCNNENLEKNKDTLIRVPVNTETTNIIVLKKVVLFFIKIYYCLH